MGEGGLAGSRKHAPPCLAVVAHIGDDRKVTEEDKDGPCAKRSGLLWDSRSEGGLRWAPGRRFGGVSEWFRMEGSGFRVSGFGFWGLELKSLEIQLEVVAVGWGLQRSDSCWPQKTSFGRIQLWSETEAPRNTKCPKPPNPRRVQGLAV